MAKLIELPNGAWIDPSYVRYLEAVCADLPDEICKEGFPPRIIMHIGDNRGSMDIRVIDFDTIDEARRHCALLARLVNESREGDRTC